MQNNPPSESVFDFDMTDFDAVPQGQYIGIFKDVQKTHHEQWGDGVMFIFEIAHGEHKGQTVTRIGKPHASKGNATGKMIAGIQGSFTPGQRADLRQFVGKYYNILMEPTQGQKTRIGQVWAYQRQQAQSMPVAPPPQQQVEADPFGSIDDIPFG